MFATMRNKRRSATMKQELEQGVDHFKRAATLAAQQTSATVGPRVGAARDRVQPAATKARQGVTSSWASTAAKLAPVAAAAAGAVRKSGNDSAEARKDSAKLGKKVAKAGRQAAKANRKDAQKNAAKLQKQVEKVARNSTKKGTGSRLTGYALLGTAVGVAAAYVLRRRSAAQWDEFEPSQSGAVTPPPVTAAHEAAFQSADPTAYTTPAGPVSDADVVVTDALTVVPETGGQTSTGSGRIAGGRPTL